MTARCDRCTHVGSVSDKRGGDLMVCMRHPPVIIEAIIAYNLRQGPATFGANDLRVASAWPAVSKGSSCGEFVPAAAPPPSRRPFRVILRERQGGTP